VLIEKRWLKEAVEATQYIYIFIIEQITLPWSDPLLEDIKSERIALVIFGPDDQHMLMKLFSQIAC
jgi:hypothetical protein